MKRVDQSYINRHIDNQFRYRGDGDYDGLLIEKDLDDEVLRKWGRIHLT